MKGFTEKRLVEDFLIEKLVELGWTYVHGDDLEREDLAEPLIISHLESAIHRLNASLELLPEEIQRVINTLKLAGVGLEGSRRVLRYLKHGVPLKREKTRIVERVRLVDYENTDNNQLVVANQVVYQGKDTIRVDIMLYVNGIPLANIECKNPTRPGQTWYVACQQIKGYENSVPDLYRYVQIGVGAARLARYFPIVPGVDNVHTYEWKSDTSTEDPLEHILAFLKPDVFLDVVRHFLFYREERGERTKVIARYMQYRAANKIVRRVLRNLKTHRPHSIPAISEKIEEFFEDMVHGPQSEAQADDAGKTRGLIWHWQGSGKTLTMIFAAEKLFHLMGNPTMFFVVDRIELEEQFLRNFTALDLPFQVEVIQSIEDLKKTLRHDGHRGKRGIFLTLIHKFQPTELRDLQEELKRLPEEYETVRTRQDIVLFIDEGHRSQYGLMAAQMKALFKNAFAFAFTGTPLAIKGRDTFREFAYPPDELYLDRYFVSDSLRDGYTVKIVYQPRLEKDVHLRRDLLEAFLETELEELPEETRQEVEDRIGRRLSAIRVFLENPRRIDKVARDIAEHFKENLDGRFKGMVVAASRRACVRFKKALDRYLPPQYSEGVMTYMAHDEAEIERYRYELARRFPKMDMDAIRDRIVERFKEEDLPKILIVTDMLLTGFDAPILQTMYLVKPLKGHRLLQAIARVNRPLGEIKEAGLIIDYVGILKRLKRAFEMYNEADLRDVLFEYDSLVGEFEILLRELLRLFEDIPRNYERETLLRAFERIMENEDREEYFKEKYWSLRKVFELLGPHEVKLEHLEEYKWLSAVYVYYVRMSVSQESRPIATRYFEKTLKYIHRSTEVKEIEKSLPVFSFDEAYLREIEERGVSDEEKAANILFALNRMVLVEKNPDPVFETIADRVERLVEAWRKRTRDYKEIYRESANLLRKLNSMRSRQRELKFSDVEYSVLLELERRFGTKEDWERVVRDLFEKLHPYMLEGWVTQGALRKSVERELRVFARGLRRQFNLSMEEMNLLYQSLWERIKFYGSVKKGEGRGA